MSYNYLDKTGLTYFWNKIKAKLDLKTNTSVIPNNSGEIKTKYRIANKAYTGSGTTIWYYPLCKLPIDNNGNYASAIISGRIGGWVSSNMSYINALAWNRSGTGISLLDIAGSGNMSNIWGTCDIVIYTDAETVSETTNDNGIDTVYLKCKGYFTFDLDLEMFQSTAEILYNGTYLTTEPTGTLVAQASTSTKRAELYNGKLYVAGSELAKASSIPTKTSQLTNDSGYTSNTGTVTSVAVKMNNTTKGTVTTSGTIDLGTVITSHQDISGKQDKLTPGTNIQINNNTISATDTKYTAGTNVQISGNNVISATDTKYTAGTGISISANNEISLSGGGGGITIDDVYPVGSIYMSVNNTDPSTLFGGTWEQLKDRFLLGAGDTYTAGNTGGEATHQLTKAELPSYDLYNASHSHSITSTSGYNGKQGNNPSLNGGNNQGSGSISVSATIKVSSGGSNQAHNNMPPYLVVYMWKRTA